LHKMQVQSGLFGIKEAISIWHGGLTTQFTFKAFPLMEADCTRQRS
jgi:hypothetical protein